MRFVARPQGAVADITIAFGACHRGEGADHAGSAALIRGAAGPASRWHRKSGAFVPTLWRTLLKDEQLIFERHDT